MTHVTPSRRAVIRTAAWSVPAVTVAAAAPAFAASPPPVAEPDLSATAPSTFTRATDKLTYKAPILSNTGAAAASGVLVSWTLDKPLTDLKFTVVYTGPAEHSPYSYITLAGNGPDPANAIGATQFTMDFPPSVFGMTVNAAGTKDFTANTVLRFADATPVSGSVTIVAKNGGAAFTQSFTNV